MAFLIFILSFSYSYFASDSFDVCVSEKVFASLCVLSLFFPNAFRQIQA